MEDLDKKTLAYGPIKKYFNLSLWNKHLDWFEKHGYRIYKLDASKWYTIEDFYSDAHEVFGFPGYFGRNWGAFDDCITDIDDGPNGNVLVAVTNFEKWKQEDYHSAHTFLDIMSDQAYCYLVRGNRFITIIQTNDPKFNLKSVGAKSVYWNQDEWDKRL